MKRIKQKDLAKQLGLSASYICEVLNRKRRPSWDVAKKLARATGSSPVVWMEGSADDLKNLLMAVSGDSHGPT